MKDYPEKTVKVRQSHFPISVFGILFGLCCLMSGVHQGIIILMRYLEWSEILQTHIVLLYWFFVAAGITLQIRWQMKKTYEIPLQMISDATRKVAQGIFSCIYHPFIQ